MSKSPEILERFEKSPSKVRIAVKSSRALTPLQRKNKSFLSTSSISSINKSFITNSNIHIGYSVYTSGFRKRKPLSSHLESIIKLNSLLLSINSIRSNQEQNVQLLSAINNTELSCKRYSSINSDVTHYIYNIEKEHYSNAQFDEEYSDSCMDKTKCLEEMLMLQQKTMAVNAKKQFVPKISCQVNMRSISRLKNEKMKIQLARAPKKKVITEEDRYYLPYMKSATNIKKTVHQLSQKTNKKVLNKSNDNPHIDLLKTNFFAYGGKGIKMEHKTTRIKNKRSDTTITQAKTTLPMYSSGLSTNSSNNSQHTSNIKRIEKLKELKKRLEQMKEDSSDNEEEDDGEFYLNTDI